MTEEDGFGKIVVPQLAIVNPFEILEMGAVKPAEGAPDIITDVDNPECQLQQNGIDLRLADAAVAIGHSRFSINKESDERCTYYPVLPDHTGFFSFQANKMYSVDFMEWIEVPEGMAAYIIMRSSINRFSGTIFGALWDSGFRGRLGTMYRPDLNTSIELGVRMAQVVFFRADSYRQYNGQYQDQQSHVIMEDITKEPEEGE